MPLDVRDAADVEEVAARRHGVGPGVEPDDARIGLQSKRGGHSDGRSAWLASMASTNAFEMVMRSEARVDVFS